MSNHLDDRIRALYAELAESAPPAPPLLSPEAVRSPWASRWPVLVAAATATIVVIAAVPLLLRSTVVSDEAADTTVVAAETTEAPTTTAVEAAPETTVAAEEIPFEDLIASRVVSVQAVDLPPDATAAADGLLIASVFEFEFTDGAAGGANVLIVVEGGEAMMLVGRSCGTEFGPPPFSDTQGGVIVNPVPLIRRCTAGEEVESLFQEGRMLTTATVDGAPVAAMMSNEELHIVDLTTGAAERLATFDLLVEEPVAASYGGGRWMVSLRDVTAPFFLGGPTRYAFFDPDGAPVSVPGNPAPDFASGASYRSAALTPDGGAMVFVEQFPDLSADVVVWDLPTGAAVERYPIIEPFVAPTEGVGGGEQFPGSVDVTDTEIIVNIDQADAEVHPGRIVRIDRTDGSVIEIEPGVDGIFFAIASFLDRP